MADRLNLIFGGMLLLLAAGVLAQNAPLADPTRPPAELLSAASAADAEGPTGPVLQSVVMPKKGKPLAVIGGQQVRLGESYGDSRLIKLTEREAVLEGPAGIERLPLTPGIEKTMIKTKTPVAKRARSGSKP